MFKGKQTCKILKEIRRQIAENNDIEYVTSECKRQGDCAGTCPKCEAEVRYLERELERRARLGKAVTVAGLAAAITATTLSATACTFFGTATDGDMQIDGDLPPEQIDPAGELPPDIVEEGELPPELTAPLTETFADVNRFLINNVNRALEKAGIAPSEGAKAFREQHTEAYIGNLNGNELYLEQDDSGVLYIIRLFFDDRLEEAGVYSADDKPDWLSIEQLNPVDFVGIREDAIQLLLTLSVKDTKFGLYYAIEEQWSEYLSLEMLFGGASYFSLPEESDASYLCILHNDDALCSVSLCRSVEAPSLPDGFFPTPDVLSNRFGIDFILSTLYNNGYNIEDRDNIRQLLREHWADCLLQSNDDYDTYHLPEDPANIARVACIGQRVHVDSYTVSADQIDIRPIAVCTPADILAKGDGMTDYLQQSIALGHSGYAFSRMLVIEYWGDYYIGSDDLADYFYATVPTEAQIAANEPLDVLVISRNSLKGELVRAHREQHGADISRFGGSGIDIFSLDALLKLNSMPRNYFSLLCRVHNLTRTELREELRYAWKSHFLRVETGVITNKFTYHTEEHPFYATSSETRAVETDIYYIDEHDLETMENLQEPGFMWIEYYEDDTIRSCGRGTYTPKDSHISE